MPKQNQHYVWKNYLKPWCIKRNRIHFSRNNEEVKVANLDRVMAEKNFYELNPLSDDDKDFLKQYVEDTKSPELKSHHRQLVEIFSLVSDFSDLLQIDNKNPISLTVEVQELLHREVEGMAIPILDELRQKQKDFLTCTTSKFKFFYYFAHQYFRTKKLRDGLLRSTARSHRTYNLSNITNIFIFMTATDLAHNLCFGEDEFDILFIESKGDSTFVTGDQPVINLLGNRQWGDSTETLFYYPLSPHLSCLITTNQYGLKSKQISGDLVNRLNGNIAWFSHEIIAGYSESAIQLAIQNKPFPTQSVKSILRQFRE